MPCSLWSSGQSSWLQIQRSAYNSRRYHIFWEIVGLERGPLNLVSTIEELLEWNSSSSGLEIREHCREDPLRWPRDNFYPQKLALNSPTSGSRSVGIVNGIRPQSLFLNRCSTCYFLAWLTHQPGGGRRLSPQKSLLTLTEQLYCVSQKTALTLTYLWETAT
jgi:hypothetical protein